LGFDRRDLVRWLSVRHRTAGLRRFVLPQPLLNHLAQQAVVRPAEIF